MSTILTPGPKSSMTLNFSPDGWVSGTSKTISPTTHLFKRHKNRIKPIQEKFLLTDKELKEDGTDKYLGPLYKVTDTVYTVSFLSNRILKEDIGRLKSSVLYLLLPSVVLSPQFSFLHRIL